MANDESRETPPQNQDYSLAEVAAAAMPAEEPVPALPPRRRNYIGIVLGTIVAILVLSVAGYGYAQRLFSGPKTMLIHQVKNAKTAQGVRLNGAQSSTLTVRVSNVHGSPKDKALLDKLNGLSVTLDTGVDLKQHVMRMHLDTNYGQKTTAGDIYLTDAQFLVAAKAFQPLIEEAAKTKLPPMPEYLVVSDPTLTSSLKDMWQQLDKGVQGTVSTEAQLATRDLLVMFLEAIPERYYHRKGLLAIEISFDDEGFHEIVKAVVATAYDHREEVADKLTTLMAASPNSKLSPADFRQQILKGLNPADKTKTLAELDKTFKDTPIHLEQTTMSLGRTFTGPTTSALTGRITVDDPQFGATIEYSVSAKPNGGESLTAPKLDSTNSLDYQKYMTQVIMATMTPPPTTSGTVQKLTVEVGVNGALAFKPAVLTAKKGTPVELTLINRDKAQAHSLVIAQLNLKSVQLPAQKQTTLRFTPTRAGTYAFYCDLPGHKDAGEVGTLIITD